MKLTKDEDSFNIEIHNDIGERIKVYNFKLFEILKNQEDARLWNKLKYEPINSSMDFDNFQIVERLKKRIEEIKDLPEYGTERIELQKILEGQK